MYKKSNSAKLFLWVQITLKSKPNENIPSKDASFKCNHEEISNKQRRCAKQL